MTGDFRAEKDHVLEEMRLWLKVLQEEKVLPPSQIELLITTVLAWCHGH